MVPHAGEAGPHSEPRGLGAKLAQRGAAQGQHGLQAAQQPQGLPHLLVLLVLEPLLGFRV